MVKLILVRNRSGIKLHIDWKEINIAKSHQRKELEDLESLPRLECCVLSSERRAPG